MSVSARRFFILVILFVTMHAPRARCQDDVSYEAWSDYNATYVITESFAIFGDVGVRTAMDNNEAWVFVVRPNARFNVGRWQFMGGIGSFYGLSNTAVDMWELRPWQGARVSWPSSGFKLTHFFRLEERFGLDTDMWRADSALRARYQLGARLRWGASNSPWSAPVSIETFLTLDESGEWSERARYVVGLERVVNREWRLRVEAGWGKAGNAFEFESIERFFLRFRVYHNLW
jgi:hypothetical protein